MSSYYGPQFEAKFNAEDFDWLMRETGLSDAAVGPPEPDRPAPQLQYPEFEPGQHNVKRATRMTQSEAYADIETGAPWLHRLADAFLFDEESTANFMRDKYGDDHVFVGTDDAMYFLPPDQLEKPAEKRQWVRFDPEGLDAGDVVAFVPQAIAGSMAALALGLSAPETLLGTAGMAALGGAAGESTVQAIGAVVGDEKHVDPLERVGRVAASSAIEGATAGAGEIAERGVKYVGRKAGELGRRAMRMGEDVAESRANRVLGQQVDMPWSVGQESGAPGALLAERTLRQNPLTADIAKKKDVLLQNSLARQADKLVRSLAKEGGEGGAQAAANAHRLRIEHLVKMRREAWNQMFGLAKDVAGDRRIIKLNNVDNALQQLKAREASDISAGDADALIEFVDRKLEELGGKKTTVQRLQNTFRNFRRIAHDGRGMFEKIQSPSLQKEVAGKLLDALRQDLEVAIKENMSTAGERVTKRLLRGETDAAGVVNELVDVDLARRASKYLEQARKQYADTSRVIDEAIANPLALYIDKPEGLLRQVFKFTDDASSLDQIMTFLDKTSPRAADAFRARVVEETLFKAGRGTGLRQGEEDLAANVIGEYISADKLAKAAEKYRKQFDALFKGRPQQKQAFNKMVRAAEILADRGPVFGSQTGALNFVNWLTKFVAAPALAGSAFLSGGQPSEMEQEITALVLTILGSRAMAKSLFFPELANKYTTLFRLGGRERLGPGAKKALRQAFLGIVREFGITELKKMQEESDEEPPLVLEPGIPREELDSIPPETQRAMQFAPAGL